MILVGLGITFHDSSIAIYDNGKIIYWKAERETGRKHAYATLTQQLKKASSLVSGPIDEIALTGWSDTDPKFTEKDNLTWINHHYAHVLSNTKHFDNSLVVDGAFTSPERDREAGVIPTVGELSSAIPHSYDVHGCYYNNGNIEHITKMSQPHFMYSIGRAMGLEPKLTDVNCNISFEENNNADKFDLGVFSTKDLWEEYYKYVVKLIRKQYGPSAVPELQEYSDKHRQSIQGNICNALDTPGKMMGLSAYHKLNLGDLEALDNWFRQWTIDERDYHTYSFKNQNIFANQLGNQRHFLSPLLDKYANKIKLAPDPIKKGIPINGRIHEFGGMMMDWYASHMKTDTFSYSGGIAQNVVWNRRLIDRGFKVWIEPWAYDGGQSIGALHYLLDKHDIERPHTDDYKQHDEAPESYPSDDTLEKIAELIAEGKTVGWYQGNGEVGPRALGYRSILANPTLKNGKDIINRVKKREWFRPFGASVKEDKASQFFDISNSRYMLFNSQVLYSGIPAVTHVDGSCRHQTVPEKHELYYRLLDKVEDKIGVPIVLNTSLNRQGEPISGSIRQAKQLYQESELDALCVGSELSIK